MKAAFNYAFPHTIPIMAGYIFLAIPFGLLAVNQELHPLLVICMSLFIYSGAMQYAAVDVLLSTFNPLNALLLGLMIGARHIFYGIAMLLKYSKLGHKRFYTIFGLTDETFSVNVSLAIPEEIDAGWVYLIITALHQFYWVFGTVIGVLLGSLITFNLEGIEFVLTALFITIFVEQWITNANKTPALVGLLSGLVFLILLGPDNFMIVAMLFIVGYFLVEYRRKGVQAT